MISVIVPVYNDEKYIAKCIESILAQEYENYEIILIDDGSIDNSGIICDDYACKYDNIFVVHNQNSGVSNARNCGITLAKGKYMTFVDSDDYISKNMLSVLYSNITKYHADIVAANFCVVNNKNKIEIHHPLENDKIISEKEIFERIIKPLIEIDNEATSVMNSSCNKLYKREIIETNNLLFDERLKQGEDWMFNIKYLLFAKKVSFIPEYLYFYFRPEEGTCSDAFRNNMFNDEVYIAELLHNLMPDNYSDYDYYYRILNKQYLSLNHFVRFWGRKNFRLYVEELFGNSKLVSAYKEIKRVPLKYKYAQKSISNMSFKNYYRWCCFSTVKTLIKYRIRQLLSLNKG